jgi:hypothetical protein
LHVLRRFFHELIVDADIGERAAKSGGSHPDQLFLLHVEQCSCTMSPVDANAYRVYPRTYPKI